MRGRVFVNPPLMMVMWDLSGASAASEEPVPLSMVSHLTISITLPIYTNYHSHLYFVLHQRPVYI